jgi:hypothetical protein
MLSFLSVFAVSVGALVVVRSLDIECANPPAPRQPAPGRFSEMFPLNAITGTR